jgi:hypothetical protein
MAWLLMAALMFGAPQSESKRSGSSVQSGAEKAAKDTVQPLINILVKWVFPVVALASALYGIARGIKRGEWDFAVICVAASIALAIIPTVLQSLFKLPG